MQVGAEQQPSEEEDQYTNFQQVAPTKPSKHFLSVISDEMIAKPQVLDSIDQVKI